MGAKKLIIKGDVQLTGILAKAWMDKVGVKKSPDGGYVSSDPSGAVWELREESPSSMKGARVLHARKTRASSVSP